MPFHSFEAWQHGLFCRFGCIISDMRERLEGEGILDIRGFESRAALVPPLSAAAFATPPLK